MDSSNRAISTKKTSAIEVRRRACITLKEGTTVEERDSTRGFFSDGACDCDCGGTTAGRTAF
jgi:hypothetical protein